MFRCCTWVDPDMMLSSATLENTLEFGLSGQTIRAKVIDVYDGDTLTLAFVFNGSLYHKRCRVKGVDCAEIRTRNSNEKRAGILAKERTHALVYSQIVKAEFDSKNDKFGRLLAWIRLSDGRRLDSILIDENLGREYHGERKSEFEK